MIELDGITTILLDIEGTICPISFVKEVLYPYALRILPSVLARDWDDPIFALYKNQFPLYARISKPTLIAHVHDLCARDVKDPALKKLQGYLWRIGYNSGEISTPLFPDVPPRLRQWIAQGKKLAIFSSGSVEAQKMFFSRVETSFPTSHLSSTHAAPGRTDHEGDVEMGDSHTHHSSSMNGANGHYEGSYEDLNDLFVANYDTINAGPKMQTSSYVRICVDLKVDADSVLFLSDSVAEVRAAKDASLKAVVVDRPGNAPLLEQDRAQLKVVGSLDEIEFDVAKDAEPGSKMDVETEKSVKTKSKRKRQSREDSNEPRNVRRSKRLSHE